MKSKFDQESFMKRMTSNTVSKTKPTTILVTIVITTIVVGGSFYFYYNYLNVNKPPVVSARQMVASTISESIQDN